MHLILPYIVNRLILTLQHAVFSAATACYYLSGELAPNDMPCIQYTDDGYMPCCREGYTCLSEALCQPPAERRPNRVDQLNPYVRSSCTNRTWKSLNCPSFWCTDEDHDYFKGSMGLAKCTNFDDDENIWQCTLGDEEEMICDEDKKIYNITWSISTLSTVEWVFTTLKSSTITSEPRLETESTSIETAVRTSSSSDAVVATKTSQVEITLPSTDSTVAEGEPRPEESENPDDPREWSKERKIVVASAVGGSFVFLVFVFIGGCTCLRRHKQSEGTHFHLFSETKQTQTVNYPHGLPSPTVPDTRSWPANSPAVIHEVPSETTSPVRIHHQGWGAVPPQELPGDQPRHKME